MLPLLKADLTLHILPGSTQFYFTGSTSGTVDSSPVALVYSAENTNNSTTATALQNTLSFSEDVTFTALTIGYNSTNNSPVVTIEFSVTGVLGKSVTIIGGIGNLGTYNLTEPQKTGFEN